MLIVALLCGLLVFFLMLLVIEYFTRDRTKISQQVQRYADGNDADLLEDKKDIVGAFMDFIRYLGLKVRDVPSTKNLDIKMQQAGWPLLGSEFLALLGVAALIFGVLGLLITMNISYAILSGLAAVLSLWLYLNIRINRRQTELSNQLGDALNMMANAMRSGFSFIQAMDLIAKEMQPPISFEFFKTIAETRLGSDTETALLNLEKRVQNPDLELVITAVLIQRQVGGNLAQILDTIGQTINERIKMKREVKTLTAQGRLSGWILAGLPFFIAGALSVVNPGYLKPLFEQPMGQMLIVVGIISEIIGIVIIRKIVDIEG